MFLFTGYTSTKTTTIRSLLSLKNDSNVKTIDIKCYSKNNQSLIDTPCLSQIEDFNELLVKAKLATESQIKYCILFFDEKMKYTLIKKIQKILSDESIALLIYDYQKVWYFSNTDLQIINSENELKEFVEENLEKQTKEIAKYILIGETNVGKSTFINQVAQHEIIKTENKKYTTQETLPINININDEIIRLYDTYGLETQVKSKVKALYNLVHESSRVLLIVDIYNYKSRFNRYIIKYIKSIKKKYYSHYYQM